MNDSFSEELRKAIERRKAEERIRVLDQHIIDSLIAMCPPLYGEYKAVVGIPPEVPTSWHREYRAEGEEAVETVMSTLGKGENMIKQEELIDMALFDSSGFFNLHELKAIKDRTTAQWSSTINDFAHVCFTANGGAFAFVIVRKSDKNIHSRILGTPHNSSEQILLLGSDKTVTVGEYSIIQAKYTGIGDTRLKIPYDYCNVVGNQRWTDGFNGGHSSQDIAEEVFSDCLESFKQAEEEGMIQNLSIASTCRSYCTAVKDIKQPIIKLMDLELF